MILSDREMMAAIGRSIHVFPRPADAMFSSTALDLTLAKRLLVWEPKTPPAGPPQRIRPHGPAFSIKRLMDDGNWARKVEIDPEDGFLFDKAGQFILGYTEQTICLPHTSRLAARVEGKSSLARLGVGVHVTAPTVHAGFGFNESVEPEVSAQPIQLEIFNISGLPIVLDVGMPICQLILEEVREVPMKGYRGQFSQQPVFAAPKKPRSRGKG